MFLESSTKTDLTGIRPGGTAKVALNGVSFYLESCTEASTWYSGVHTTSAKWRWNAMRSFSFNVPQPAE